MPTPPVTNPTPYTCPQCGAGLGERAEFCPHCGARLQLAAATSAGWFASNIALGLGALIFGGVGACSGQAAISAFGASTADYIRPVVLGISVPILIFGVVCAWLCGRALWRRLRT